MSIIVPYIFSRDHILEAVKQESSLYAERKIASDGHSLFEQFVFDEEYFRKFREKICKTFVFEHSNTNMGFASDDS